MLTERSVSRAALRLGMYQPAVSASLKRLRELAGDPLLVRSGASMVPTEAGLRMVEPSASILRSAEVMFSDARGFDPASTRITFRIAATDYLDPQFLPRLLSHVKRQAPLCHVELLPLTASADYHAQLAQGEVEVVIGNWASPSDDLHMGPLFDDEVVSMVARDHPALRRAWTQESWLESEHVAPTPMHPGAKGFVDSYLESQGLRRNITARCSHFGLIPPIVASSLLILTTGRQYCERFLATLPLAVLACPVKFPTMKYYQLWHERSHGSASAKWLREQVALTARSLRSADGPRN